MRALILPNSVPTFLAAILFAYSGAVGCGSGDEATVSNTAEVVAAANAFLATLTTAEAAQANLTYSSANAKNWSNLPIGASTRNGVMFGNLTAAKQTAASALIKAALSTAGNTYFEQIRLADQYLAGINASNWGSAKYYVAIIGTPSTSATWMLQITGHHVTYNMTYHGSATNGTPMFAGAEPSAWTDSAGAHTPLETQRAAVHALAQTLLGNSSATITGTFTDIVMGPSDAGFHDSVFPKTYPTTNRGVLASTLTAAQKVLIKTAIEAWVNTMPSSVATPLLAAYETDAAINATYVGLGLTASTTVDFSTSAGVAAERSYLRIDGPRVWIEMVIQNSVEAGKIHYHSIWRDKTADYGAEF